MSVLSDKYPAIVRAYQQATGQDPSDDEILSQTGNGQFAPNDPRIAYSVANIIASGQGGVNSSLSLPKGIGTSAEVNQANQFVRGQPWYQAMLSQWGQDPSRVNLDPKEQQILLDQLRQRGINVSDHFEIDKAGNITPKSSLGKKLLIGAAIGGAALTGLGLAGVGPMAGLFGGGGAAAGTGGAAASGVLPSTAVGTGFVPAIAGGTAALPGAPAGLASSTVGTGMATLPGSVASGDIGGAATAGATAGPAAKGALQKIGGAIGSGKIGDLLGGAGAALGGAATAAGNNALDQEKLALEANQLNTTGQSAFVNELLGLATEEGAQRNTALKDAYRSSFMANPRVSPFDPSGGPKLSPQFQSVVSGLGDQGASMLGKPLSYDVASMPRPSYTPINIKDVQGATNTKPGALQQIGNWLSPALTVGGKIANLFGG